jgi:hypothetical protein
MKPAPNHLHTGKVDAPTGAAPSPQARPAAEGPPPAFAPAGNGATLFRETAKHREEFASIPAFVVMLVMAAAERYLVACMLTKAANKGSWPAIEAYVFLFDRQPTFMSIVLGFDIQEVHPVGSPLTFLRFLLQLVHFGSHWLLAFYCFRWCYRLSRLAGHGDCAVAAILMVALWFIVLPALGAHLPGPRKAEKEPPRSAARLTDLRVAI